jgi:signal transduction histidine kinase
MHPSEQIEDRFFRQLVTSMRNGVLAITRDGRVVVMNAEAYRVLGLQPGDNDAGRPFTQVLADQPDVSRILGSAFELSHLPNRAELRLKPSGKVIGYTLSHVLDDDRRAIGAALFFKDLTQVEQLEERERLRDRLAALGEMAAAIAHEVKNPLAGIEVMAGLLRRRVPDCAEVQGLLTDIINEAKMANAIVVEVLEFVRPIRLQVEPTSVAQVLREAITMAESKAKRGGVVVKVHVPQDLPPIHADHHQLCQLFTNLLTNAFEALDGRGSVSTRAWVEPGPEVQEGSGEPAIPSLVVEVADDGPGVAEDFADKIFNPFMTSKPQGSGLGLAIVRKIVDAHEGRIDLTTTRGRGTCFRVTLPVCTKSALFL